MPVGALDGTLSGLIREMRPWQWYKQGVLLLGIIFSKNVLNLTAWRRVTVAVASFCAVAGAVYVFNDIVDVEEDRNHPTKRHRPIASGQVSVPVAGAFGVGLLLFGLGAAYVLGPLVLLVVAAYLAQNALYSLYLKRLVLVDVIVIAIGFVLRAVAGVVAIDVYLSPWLVVCTFLAALLLAIGKRRHELFVGDDPVETRQTLEEYTVEELDQLLVVVVATLLVSYSLYTFFRATNEMMLTLPFAFFSVFRYQHLVHAENVGNDPKFLFLDRPFVLNFVAWMIVAVVALYGGLTPVLELIR